MDVRFTPIAERELAAVVATIRADDAAAARRFRDRVFAKVSRLERFPLSGHVVPEFPEAGVREIIVRPYRFFYRVEGRTVWLFAVWHGARIPEEPSE